MSLDPSSPVEYLIGHLEDRLARDPRLAEQGLHVALSGDPPTVVVSGTVLALEHRDAVDEVVAEALPGVALCNETTLADYPEDPTREEVG